MKNTLLMCQIYMLAYLTRHRAGSSSCTLGPYPIVSDTASGTIQSPGYPTHYHENEDCFWILYPPSSGGHDIIVIHIQFSLHPFNVTDEAYCEHTKDYVSLQHVVACGSEEPACLVFIGTWSTDDNCHKIYSKNFSHCAHFSIDELPFTVSFHSENQQMEAGFEMNYTFIHCATDTNGPELPVTRDIAKTPKPTTTTSTTVSSHIPSQSKPGNSQSPDNGIIILAAIIAFLTIFTIFIIAATLRKRSRTKRRSQQSPSPDSTSCNSEMKAANGDYKKQELPLETISVDDSV